jgi:hypothetical protein
MPEYRKRAEECVQLAQSAKPHQRAILLDIATKWLMLAAQDAETQALLVQVNAKKMDGHGGTPSDSNMNGPPMSGPSPVRTPETVYCPTCKTATMRLRTILPLPLLTHTEWEATYLCSTCRGIEKRSAKV